MKRSIKTLKSGLAVIAVTLLLVSPELGQRSVEKLSGYVNLERIGHLDDYFERQATIEVNVEGPLMRLVAAASRFEDPELADLLLKLDGVFVRGFELDPSDRDAFEESASRIGDYLESGGGSVVGGTPRGGGRTRPAGASWRRTARRGEADGPSGSCWPSAPPAGLTPADRLDV